MGTDRELPDEGSSRRSFLRRMAVAGLVTTPVVSTFSLFGGCEGLPGWPGGGGNTGGGSNT